MNKMLWPIVAVVSLFFLFVGTVKVTGWPASFFELQMREYFTVYGISRPLVFLIGLAELFGAVTIWLHRTHWIGLAGAGALVVVTAGALLFHLSFDTFQEAVPALVMLVLSGLILSISGFDYLQRSKENTAV